MTVEAKYNCRKNISNIFGALGYFACLMQWFWATILYISFLKSVVLFISPETNNVVTKTNTVVNYGSNTPSIIFAVIVTILVLILTIYVLIKMPSTVLKTSKKVVAETAESVAPIVLKVQHKKDTKKNHIKLTSQIVLVIKIVLVIIPIILSFMSKLLKTQMFDFNIVMFVGVWLAAFTLIFFAFQYLIAKFLAVRNQDLW